MICKNVTIIQKPCSNGYSKQIQCHYDIAACLKDCSPRCPHWEPIDASPLYAIISSRTKALRQLVEQTQCCNQGQPNYLESNNADDGVDNPYQSETDYSL
ncbi:MAG: hypothetical protein LBI05_00875 [Planctomycetaceae bacterium]|jgi:hypothetical protein|nr:hypothetical protein [Planctomycetaceae bacterium]